jgi:uncharacterized protein
MKPKPKKTQSAEPAKPAGIRSATLDKARAGGSLEKYRYPVQRPTLFPGVVPKGVTPPVLAADSAPAYEFAAQMFSIGGPDWVGFPGYPYLAALSTRAEYRNFASAYSTQLTREWIVLNSTETAGDETKEKCKLLMQDLTNLGLKDTIQRAAAHNEFYGRAQLLINLENSDLSLPLILSDKTIKQVELNDHRTITRYLKVKAVEALWTTPKAYNAIDPAADDFYKPTSWFVLGKEVHASRLLTIITREVSDMLKPAYNFGGISMSQLAEPYVDNWLRTRQSVSDLINNFSIISLGTAMEQVLNGDDNGDNLFKRAELFTLTRSNRGLFLRDKEREEIDQIAVPLSGLDALQAQSQEQMCSVSHTPAVVLLGIAPTGFGNVAEGEIRSYYDYIAAEQEAHWRKPIETVLNIVQLLRYGVIDPDIILSFQPLYQMTPKELSEIRKADAEVNASYVDRQILSQEEVRESLARNPESGYQGIDVEDLPEPPEGNEDESGQELENEDAP